MRHLNIPSKLDADTLVFAARFCEEFASTVNERWSTHYDPKLANALEAIANALGNLATEETHGS